MNAPATKGVEAVVQCQSIAIDTETDNLTARNGRDHRMMPKLLACVDVANVHLDDRCAYTGECVAQRDTVMTERARIDDDCSRPGPCCWIASTSSPSWLDCNAVI